MKAVKIILGIVLAMGVTLNAHAADIYWTGDAADSNWSDPHNWHANGSYQTPVDGDYVHIVADNYYYPITYVQYGDYDLRLGQLEIDNGMSLGIVTGDLGLQDDGVAIIGNTGEGLISQVPLTSFKADNADVYLGYQPTSYGEYQMGDAQFFARKLVVGEQSTTASLFDQTSGTVTVNQDLVIADLAGSRGLYSMNNNFANTPVLHVKGNELIGVMGEGTFSQTQTESFNAPQQYVDGNVVLGGAGWLAEDYGTSGEVVTGTGHYHLYNSDGSFLQVAGDEVLGAGGTGSFNQESGTNSVTGNLLLGTTTTVQESDYNWITHEVAGTGTYDMSGGFLYVGGNLVVGDDSQGAGAGNLFHQSGGQVQVQTDLILGNQEADDTTFTHDAGRGTYHLIDGNLTVEGQETIGLGGEGHFVQDGGVHNVWGNWFLLGSGNTGTYDLNNGTLTTVNEEYGDRGQAIFTQFDGIHHVIGSVFLAWDYRTNPAETPVEYWLKGGSLTVELGDLTVGASNPAAFYQQGGSAVVGDCLILGADTYGQGAYSMENGTLNTSNIEIIGSYGSGIFTQKGGINTTKAMALGRFVSGSNVSSGTYDLQDGQLTVTNTLTVGDQGVGLFKQSGGVLNAGEIVTGGQGTFDYTAGEIHAPVTNNGTFKVTNAPVTFDHFFINNGAIISDPAVLNFTDLTVNPSGFISAAAGDEYRISRNFLNHSIQNSLWNTEGARLVFGIGDHTFALAGADLGAGGFRNNFAWAVLDLTGTHMLSLVDGNPDNSGTALYIGELLGLEISGQIIDNLSGKGVSIFYDPSQAGNGYLKGGTFMLADGGMLAPVVTPEPVSVVLFGLGGAAMALARRRRKT